MAHLPYMLLSEAASRCEDTVPSLAAAAGRAVGPDTVSAVAVGKLELPPEATRFLTCTARRGEPVFAPADAPDKHAPCFATVKAAYKELVCTDTRPSRARELWLRNYIAAECHRHGSASPLGMTRIWPGSERLDSSSNERMLRTGPVAFLAGAAGHKGVLGLVRLTGLVPNTVVSSGMTLECLAGACAAGHVELVAGIYNRYVRGAFGVDFSHSAPSARDAVVNSAAYAGPEMAQYIAEVAVRGMPNTEDLSHYVVVYTALGRAATAGNSCAVGVIVAHVRATHPLYVAPIAREAIRCDNVKLIQLAPALSADMPTDVLATICCTSRSSECLEWLVETRADARLLSPRKLVVLTGPGEVTSMGSRRPVLPTLGVIVRTFPPTTYEDVAVWLMRRRRTECFKEILPRVQCVDGRLLKTAHEILMGIIIRDGKGWYHSPTYKHVRSVVDAMLYRSGMTMEERKAWLHEMNEEAGIPMTEISKTILLNMFTWR